MNCSSIKNLASVYAPQQLPSRTPLRDLRFLYYHFWEILGVLSKRYVLSNAIQLF